MKEVNTGRKWVWGRGNGNDEGGERIRVE